MAVWTTTDPAISRVIADSNNKILIVDSDNHVVILVMNFDLTFSHSFGVKGSQLGRFGSPRYIAIDRKSQGGICHQLELSWNPKLHSRGCERKEL